MAEHESSPAPSEAVRMPNADSHCASSMAAASALGAASNLLVWQTSDAQHQVVMQMLHILASQAADCKASVRKSSVQLSVSLYILIELAVMSEVGEGLACAALQHCQRVVQATARDVAVSVRKAAIDAISFLTTAAAGSAQDEACMRLWARIVVPRLQDGENSVQQAAVHEVCKPELHR
jgi:HEAT repeat associated with sister chromatid cohesion